MYIKVWKRVLDIAAALLGAILLWPVLAVLAALGAIIMRGNPFFVQIRPGKDEKLFKMVKFRSMTCAKDQSGNLLPDDQRLTAYGRFLRSSSLDELPELFNILKGDMSLVGTRPPTVDEWEKYELHHRKRLAVKPGITGLWQVSGRSNITDFDEVVKLDLEYIDNWSVGLDIKILFMTVYTVLFRRGAV